MSRLAAYYQEDHLHPPAAGPRRNKYAYFLCEDPAALHRLQASAFLVDGTSPAFLPGFDCGMMTLKQRPLVHFGRYDDGSMYSFDPGDAYVDRHRRSDGPQRLAYALTSPDRYDACSPIDDPDFYECDNRYYQITPDQYYGARRYQHVLCSPSLLSPPSPLDSGLSSQSLPSSPSLDAESQFCHAEYEPVFGHERQSTCSCLHSAPCPEESYRALADRHGSNGTQYSDSYRVSRCADFDQQVQCSSQKRYGKLGLVGEPLDVDFPSHARERSSHHHHQKDQRTSKRNRPISASQEGRKLVHAARRVQRTREGHEYIRPFVVITKASEVAAGSPSREDLLAKTDESPMSVTDSCSSGSVELESELESRPKSRRETEREIRELEAMYNRCNLDDGDLLDRAERRDLPTAHQGLLRRCKSDTLFESPLARPNPYEAPRRAPPSRRSGRPDRVADDMAHRKLVRSSSSSSRAPTPSIFERPSSYMLCNAHFTPSGRGPGVDLLLPDRVQPDPEADDLCLRTHYLRKKSAVADPQPPFGIPLRPPPRGTMRSDYLHAVPSGVPPPLCHPRRNPDVVRDDLAFRALRKDEPDRLYYDVARLYSKRKGR